MNTKKISRTTIIQLKISESIRKFALFTRNATILNTFFDVVVVDDDDIAVDIVQGEFPSKFIDCNSTQKVTQTNIFDQKCRPAFSSTYNRNNIVREAQKM